MQILRHEAGHAFDNAYELRSAGGAACGCSAGRRRPIRISTCRKPYSKSFVLHLDSWYAQSHPDEDFAETFAVWLTPDSDWRSRYADWPALRKLEYMDALMHEIAGQPPVVATRRAVEPLERLRTTLRKHYAKKRAHYGLEYPNFYDRDLRRLFSDAPRVPRTTRRPRAFIQRSAATSAASSPNGPGSYQYTIDRVIEDMIARSRRAAPAPEVSGGPHEARLHDARDGADDELPALGTTSGGAVERLITQSETYDVSRGGSVAVGRASSAVAPAIAGVARSVSADRAADHRRVAANDFAWQRLAEVTDTYGPRLSGSEALERAIDWAVAAMKKDGLENVRKEPRDGAEVGARPREPRAASSRSASRSPMLGLGNSVGTPAGGIEGRRRSSSRTSTISNARAADVKGRIVLFNVPFTNYGETVVYRATGPSRGARARRHRDARPLGRARPASARRTPAPPTTTAGAPKIPAAAIPAEDADRFQRLQDSRRHDSREALDGGALRCRRAVLQRRRRDARPRAARTRSCRRRPLRFVGPRRRRQRRRRRLRRDVGSAAADEEARTCGRGARCASCCSRTRRTAAAAATAIATRTRPSSRNHVLLMESDGGVFDPAGFGFTGPEPARADGDDDRERC